MRRSAISLWGCPRETSVVASDEPSPETEAADLRKGEEEQEEVEQVAEERWSIPT